MIEQNSKKSDDVVIEFSSQIKNLQTQIELITEEKLQGKLVEDKVLEPGSKAAATSTLVYEH